MEIDKKDAIFLDLIIEKIIETDQPIWSDTFKDSENLNIVDEKLRELEFTRLINIIDYRGVGKSQSYQFAHDSIQRNEKTVKFKERGGFTKLFQDELDKIERENEIEALTTKKLKWDAKLSKWQVKTFWYVFIFGLAGFILGIFNFVDNQKKKKSIEELQLNNQNIQEEVSKLRTLVLDQKTVDSLHSSRTQIDSLRPR